MASKGGAGDDYDDPHANYRVDRYNYLVIEENGEYDVVSFGPKEIPEGVVVEPAPVDSCVKGVRHFRVFKNGMDNTFDLVTVGTITVQNGFAYIAGHYIHGEAPDRSNEFVNIPPLAITFSSIDIPDDLNEFAKEMESKVHKLLKEQVAKYCLVSPASHLDIDLKRPYSLEQKNLCRSCGDIMYTGGYGLCDSCAQEIWAKETHVSSSTNPEGCGGDKVETE